MLASALPIFLGATLALASVVSVFERSDSGPNRCSTFISVDAIIQAEKDFCRAKSPGLWKRGKLRVRMGRLKAGTSLDCPYRSDAIRDQMDVLNNDFAKTGLSFDLVNITRTINADWFKNAAPYTDQQAKMKGSLRQGGANTLNIYSVGFSTTDHLGYATFPNNYADQPQDDGVVFLYSSVPGGTNAPYNGCRTVTHEVGHWVGLYHTFQGGCQVPGDYVVDTPAEASPAFGCPASRNTRSTLEADPVHNFMDYTDDSCMTEFTDGQVLRLQEQVRKYREVDI
ncbi:Metallo peptidase [Lactarius tabidus]